MTLEIGTRLGHYRILSLLGRGGMADVYRAEDERLGREVALKAVPPEFARDPERVERFEREVRAAARLSHPNIVTVHEFGQGAGQHFYTMELMPGGDLKARIREHPEGMPPSEVRAIAAAIARALDYAHKRGYVHRDVKPENILFWEDGTPQLTDFGIARAMGSETGITDTGMIIGSPHYMSPEQAQGLEVDGRSDLYSLGVVLYEMLTGRLPFDAPNTFAVGLSHIKDPVPDLPRALAEWQPVVDRLLAKSPEDRYGSAGELAEVLGEDRLPRPAATPVLPVERKSDPISDAPPWAPYTRLMPEGSEVVPTSQAGESGTRLVEPPKPRRTLQAAVAGSVLALAVVGIGYLALRDTSDPKDERVSGGGSARVRTEPVQTEPMQTEPERPTRSANREQAQEPVRYGSLTLDLNPSDARVTLPDVTPRYRPGVRLREGTHRVLVRREGYREAIRRVKVSGASRVRIALEKRGPSAGESRVFDGMEFVWIPPGVFRMGAASQHADDNERPVTRVRITRGVWLGKYEVTQGQWESVMGSNPSRYRNCGTNCPVETVSWNDVQEFVRKFNRKSGERRYRLPTEAEWEYAARGGTNTDTYAGDLRIRGKYDAPLLARISWYGGNSGVNYAGGYDCSGWEKTQYGSSRCGPHPVGRKAPNEFGLHDMLGGVWEWVGDWYGNYPGRTVTDPVGPNSGSARVIRGGSWGSEARHCRSGYRYGHSPVRRYGILGFRLLRTE